MTIVEGMAAQLGKPATMLLLIQHNTINGSAKDNMVAQASTIAKDENPSTEFVIIAEEMAAPLGKPATML